VPYRASGLVHQPLADVGRLLASGTPRDQLRRDPTAGPSSIGGNRQVTPAASVAVRWAPWKPRSKGDLAGRQHERVLD